MVTKVVAASGGDYTSKSGWDAGEAGDVTAAGRDELPEAQCNDFNDTTKITLQGWTTDVDHYWRMFANDNHFGLFSIAVHRTVVAFKDALKVNDAIAWGRVEGLQWELSGGTVGGDFVKNTATTAGTVLWDKVIIINTGGVGDGSKSPVGLQLKNDLGDPHIVRNSLFYGWLDSGSPNNSTAVQGKHFDIDNNTVIGGDQAYNTKDALSRGRNNIADGAGDGYVGTTWAAGTSNNQSDIASDAPGTSPQTGSVTFVAPGSDDYHLASGDTIARANGINLSAVFTDDIDGDTRSAWDIGADEFQAAPGGLALPVAMFLYRQRHQSVV